MLASLLPGLRDVRTPLTLGYLWLLFLWLCFADRFPDRTTRPGPVADLYKLSDFLGNTAAIATLSFTAYILGAMVALPVEGRLANAFLYVNRVPFLGFKDVRLDETFEGFLKLRWNAYIAQGALPEAAHDVFISAGARPEQLRPRLLSSGKPEVYGEYDRLASEAAFRLNIAFPLLALGIFAAHEFNRAGWILAGTAFVFAVLVVQGCRRIAQSQATLTQAMVDNVITHPYEDVLIARYGPLQPRTRGKGVSVMFQKDYDSDETGADDKNEGTQ